MFPLNEILFFNDLAPTRDGELNMALDEILLQECHLPWLRVYDWSKKTISIGYFTLQNTIEHVNKPWVRRWTGGGLVHHGGARDATFAFGIPRCDPVSSAPSYCSYRDIHQSVQQVLSGMGIDCDLDAGDSSAITGGSCFENPVRSDVIARSDGLKIVGGAQRRSRHGLLHQGSIQGVHVPAEFGAILANSLARKVQQLQVDDGKVERGVTLANSKYSSPEWRYRT
jgi:lipoate-protein ligase A